MKGATLRRALGLTLLYTGIFVLLVLLQFPKGAGFSASFGRLSAAASFAKRDRGSARDEARLQSVRLSFAGFRIEISDAAPASLVKYGEGARELQLESIAKIADGVLVVFKGGVSLSANADRSEESRFLLSADLPEGAAELRLAYELKSARLDSKDGAMVLEAAGGPYAVSLSNAALGQGVLAIRPSAAARPALAMRKAAPAKPAAAAAVAVDKYVPHQPKDAASQAALVGAWRDKAWASLSSIRYDQAKIAWSDPDGEVRFNERALAAYCAEAASRGSFDLVAAISKASRERWPDRLTYMTAPFVGGLTPKMEALEAADVAEIKRLSQLIQEKSPELFSKENLVHYLFDRAPFALAQEALRFAAEVDPAKFDLRQTVGLLGCVVESDTYLKAEENPFRASKAAAERLLASIRATSSGAFLVTEEDGSTDIRLSVLAGTYLMDYGVQVSEPQVVAAGQDLVSSALALVDDRGFIPARASAKGGALDLRSGALAPEDIYPIVAGNPYFPREVSFYRDLAPGIWAWTCSPELKVESTEKTYRFAASYPTGRSHYIAFYGIKPFVNIQLYGIDYSPDAQYEIYDASGYLYKKTTGGLYMKMKHKKDSEEIKLFF